MSNLSTQSSPPDLRALLKSDKVKDQIALALPKHMDPDRMMRVALTATNKNGALLNCDTGSVLTALMTCSACGIEPDGRNAHLIPYGKTCQLIIDFKGYVILAKRNGLKNIHGDIVCENDTFIWKRDETGLHFLHEFDFKKPRGEMYAAYVIWNEASGDFCGEIMQKDEVDAIRKRSRASGSGPWVTDYNEMAKKTVIRRASKKWDITPEIRDAIEADDQQFERDVTPEPAKPKFLRQGKTEPAPETQPAETTVLPAEQEQEAEPGTSTPEPTKPVDLLREVETLQDSDGISTKVIKAWAVRENIVTSEAILLKNYGDEALKYILANWESLKAGEHTA